MLRIRVAAVVVMSTALLIPAVSVSAATVPAQAGVVAVSSSSYHRVVAGDTLWRIASRYCGSGGRYRQLAQANGISNPDRIWRGQMLKVGGTACAGRRPATGYAAPVSTSRPAGKVATVIAYAKAQIGDPYRWAAAGPDAFDCSGLVMAAYARVGVRLPHQSGAMLSYGTRVSRSQLRPGDLVWPQYGHVGIYVGGGRFIHSPRPGQQVQVSALYGFYTARRLIR